MSTMLASEPRPGVADVIKKVGNLATLPQTTLQIMKTVEDPKSTAQQLHKIVSHDPALVSRILKVVNSAFYGLPGQIGSVERAIVVLGLNGIKNIAVAASLGQLFRGGQLCEGFATKDLWTHCIAVGVGARDLARNMKLNIADEAFLAGLIHDIGILVSLQLQPEKVREVCEAIEVGADFCETERRIIGWDHQQLGMALAQQWKFPKPCQLAAGHHHHPQALSGPERQFVALVHAADIIACRGNYGFNLTASNQLLTPQDLAELQLDEAALHSTESRLEQLVSEAAQLLG